MSEGRKNKRSGLRHFLRYRKGELSGVERNSFERELQKDPFAEEAMEGMLSVTPEEFSADVKRMQAAIRSKRLRRKRYMYYRIAASVAMLMIISSVFFVLNRGNQGTVLTPDAGIQTTAEILKPEPVIRPDENVSNKPEEKTKTVENTNLNKTDKKLPSEPSLQPEENRNDVQLVNDYSKEARARSLTSAGRALVKGNVVSADDSMPVTGALEEVVVTGYGQNKEHGQEDYLPPRPVNGMDDLNRYIEKNIHRPESLTGQRVVVVAGIRVRADGSIDSIRIIRSPGPEFSEEALRLIRSGPQWLPAEQSGEKIDDSVRVRIVFR